MSQTTSIRRVRIPSFMVWGALLAFAAVCVWLAVAGIAPIHGGMDIFFITLLAIVLLLYILPLLWNMESRGKIIAAARHGTLAQPTWKTMMLDTTPLAQGETLLLERPISHADQRSRWISACVYLIACLNPWLLIKISGSLWSVPYVVLCGCLGIRAIIINAHRHVPLRIEADDAILFIQQGKSSAYSLAWKDIVGLARDQMGYAAAQHTYLVITNNTAIEIHFKVDKFGGKRSDVAYASEPTAYDRACEMLLATICARAHIAIVTGHQPK